MIRCDSISYSITDHEIADRYGLKPEVVRVYESVFFSMRAFLSERETLAQAMFGSAFSLCFRDSEVGRLWAYVGLTGPTAALATFIDAFHAAWRPKMQPTLGVYLREGAPVPLDVQALVASYLLSNDVTAAPSYFHCHAGLIAVEHEPDPRRQQEMKDELKRMQIKYVRGLLAGKSERQLQRLLRDPPKRLQERKAVVRVQEQPTKSASTIPTTAASDAGLVEAQEIDRLSLPAKFDVGVLRAGGDHSG